MLTVGPGACCSWKPGYRPSARRKVAEAFYDLSLIETCRAWGFHRPHFWQDGTTRYLELLGPDSPAEYVYTMDTAELVDATVEDMARDVLWWIEGVGRMRKAMTNG